jgi:hypothetical protein
VCFYSFFCRCARLKKENDEFRQQLTLNRSNNNNSNDQQQIELLRQMVRSSEDALAKKADDLRTLTDQVNGFF